MKNIINQNTKKFSKIPSGFLRFAVVTAGSSSYVGLASRACPCCGKNMVTCAVGLSTVVLVGSVIGLVSAAPSIVRHFKNRNKITE